MYSISDLINELSFKATKSSGKGGQHVNKVASKIELSFNVNTSKVLNDVQKQRLLIALKPRLTNDGLLILQCSTSRSQHQNKTLAIQRFLKLIEEGLIVRKVRKKKSIPKSVIEKRLKNKKLNSQKKAYRQRPNID